MVTDSSEMLTVKEVAMITNQSYRQIHGHIKAGTLKYINIGLGKKRKSYIIPREFLNEFLENMVCK